MTAMPPFMTGGQMIDCPAIQAHGLRLTRRLLDGLAVLKGVRLIGPVDIHDRRGVVSFAVEGFSAEEVCRHMDNRGVALCRSNRSPYSLSHFLMFEAGIASIGGAGTLGGIVLSGIIAAYLA